MLQTDERIEDETYFIEGLQFSDKNELIMPYTERVTKRHHEPLCERVKWECITVKTGWECNTVVKIFIY